MEIIAGMWQIQVFLMELSGLVFCFVFYPELAESADVEPTTRKAGFPSFLIALHRGASTLLSNSDESQHQGFILDFKSKPLVLQHQA